MRKQGRELRYNGLIFPMALYVGLMVWLLMGCDNPSSGGASTGSTSTTSTTSTTTTTTVVANADDHEEDSDYVWSEGDEVAITLGGTTIAYSSGASGVTVEGSTATITAAGTYLISGTLSDGQIIVDTQDSGDVRLILDDAGISCSTSAPLYVKSAAKTVIVLASGSTNALADGGTSSTRDSEGEPDAALFSKDDLTIYGEREEGSESTGSLTVAGNYADAIACKDGLVLNGANVTVTSAADDGIRGKDYIVVEGGTIAVTAAADGMKSTNEDEDSLGYISISSGTFTITAGNDALQAETNIDIADGTFTLKCGGGSSYAVASDASSKGIKGLASVDIDGGVFSIDSADDCIHSNGSIAIDGGSFALATYSGAGDGIHADGSLTVNAGAIAISACYEGLESALVTVAGGSTRIVASDDGVNVSGDADTSTAYLLSVTGGYLYVSAAGDGLDSNGSISISGGTVIVNGPLPGQSNAALDYADELSGTYFSITGGLVVAAGSSSMLVSPTSVSQPTAVLKYSTSSTTHPGSSSGTSSSYLSAGTIIHIQASGGASVLSFAPSKNYQSLIFSSPDLVGGTSYSVYTGGSDSSTATDGLYSGGTYSSGTSRGSFTASSSSVVSVSIK